MARCTHLVLDALRPDKGRNAKVLGAVYARVLATVPEVALEEAADLLIHGDAGLSKAFAPEAPEFLDVCRKRVDYWRARAAHLRLIIDYPEARAVPQLTDEQRTANLARIAALRTRAADAVAP